MAMEGPCISTQQNHIWKWLSMSPDPLSLYSKDFSETVTVEAESKPTSEICLERHRELKRKEERIQVQRQHYPEIC